MLDFAEPIGGVDAAAFEAALSKRVTEVLALPGWMAVQPFRLATPPAVDARPHLPFPKYMVIWENRGRPSTGAAGQADRRDNSG
jgi:hypothetical protein